MNTQTTIEKLKLMRLKGMAELYHSAAQSNLYNDYTTDQYIALLTDREWEYRQNRKMENLIRKADFRTAATIKNIDYSAPRGLDKNQFERLATLEFLKQKLNIIITGPTGTGKSYLAQALGHQACIFLHKTRYFTQSALAEQLHLAKIKGTYSRFLKQINQAQLLIIEDFGLQPMDNLTRNALMDIADHKYDKASFIITSQIPVNQWHQLFGEATIADAIMDRIVHSAHRIELKGQSMRKAKSIIQL